MREQLAAVTEEAKARDAPRLTPRIAYARASPISRRRWPSCGARSEDSSNNSRARRGARDERERREREARERKAREEERERKRNASRAAELGRANAIARVVRRLLGCVAASSLRARPAAARGSRHLRRGGRARRGRRLGAKDARGRSDRAVLPRRPAGGPLRQRDAKDVEPSADGPVSTVHFTNGDVKRTHPGGGWVLLPGGGHVAHDAPGRDGGVSLSERTDGGARTQRVQGDPVPGRTAPSRVSGREGGGRARALRRTRGRTSRTRSARTWEYISHTSARERSATRRFLSKSRCELGRVEGATSGFGQTGRARGRQFRRRGRRIVAPRRVVCALGRSERARFSSSRSRRLASRVRRVGSAAAALASRCGDGGARRRRARVACPARPP